MSPSMATTREQVLTALFNQLQTMQGIVYASRRLKLWDAVDQQPALFMAEHREDKTSTPRGVPNKLLMTVSLFIYFKASDEAPGSITMNNLLDALDSILSPPAYMPDNTYTIGGLVNRCWINGTVLKDPGDIDGQGVAIVPLQILFP